MHNLAIISTIKSIAPIEGKDRIVLANVENYNCIIAKDDFKVDDKVIYVFYDAILPEKPEFEFLRKRCWSEKYKGFKIRPMKLGGVVSEGLVLPMTILPGDKYNVGDVVTDKLGIRLYDPEAKESVELETKKNRFVRFLYKFSWFRNLMSKHRQKIKARELERNKYDSWTKESDEENIEKCYDKVKDLDIDFVITEKVEGTAALYSWYKGKFKVFSHHRRVYAGTWFDYAKIHNLERKLQMYCENHNLEGIAIAGELIGPNIQHNIYQKKELELYLYGGYHLDRSTLTWDELQNVSQALCISTVPFVKVDKVDDLDTMLKESEGKSVIFNVPREGYVYRSFDGKIHFKVKSRAYKVWFEKKEPLE